jgi:outer membrane lipoprotein-sorting protein
MKFILACLVLCLFLDIAPAPAESPSDILFKSDASRTIPDMSMEVRITSYDAAQVSDQSTLWGVMKLGRDHNRLLFSFRAPASKQGQKFLVDGEAVYVLFEHTTNPIRVSPLEVLSGQASDGDVVRTFAADYTVASMTRTSLDERPALHFDLTAIEGANVSSYAKVQLWIDPEDWRLLYAEFYAASGVLLKKAYYRDYRSLLGKDFPCTIDIWAGDNARKHTTMVFAKIGRQVLPDTEFRRTSLAFWNPEAPR